MSERYFKGQRSQPKTEFMSNHDFVGVLPHYYKKESDRYEAGSRRGDKPRVSNLDGAGDTIMVGVNTSGVAKRELRRALWKSKSKIEKLRSEGKCFKCERRGCITRNCPLLQLLGQRVIALV